MIIKNISIQNFQSYFDFQCIEFSEGLNLVIGKGGKGKSKLFNAFYWVLFGKIYITDVCWCNTEGLPQSSKGAMFKHEFINKRALSLATIGDSVTTCVKIEIEDDNGITYLIDRSLTAVRLNAPDWDSPDSWAISPAVLRVSHDSPTGTRVKMSYEAEDVIKRLFPDEIRDYIWFQGESLESLIDFRDKRTLEKAVNHISYYPYYERLSAIITKSKSKIERQETSSIKQINKHNSEVQSLLIKMQGLRQLISSEEERQSRINDDIEKVKQAIVEDDNKLQGLASFSKLIKDYDDCEGKIKDINNEITAIDNYQRRQLPSLWILRNTDTLVQKSKDLIDNYAEKEFSTPEQKFIDNPGKSKLQEILKDHKCFVCGSDVPEGSIPYNHILHRIEEQEAFFRAQQEYINNIEASKRFTYFMGKIQDYPENLQRSLEAIDKQWKDSEEKLESLKAKRRRYLEDKRELDEKINEAKKRYGVDPVKEAHMASNLGSVINASRSNLEKLKREADISAMTLKEYESKLTAAESEFTEKGASGGTITVVPETQWKQISSFLEDICSRVQEDARIELLHKIEERANVFYVKFTEHDAGYKGRVTIDQDYSIEFDPGLNTSHEDRKKMSIINALLSLNQEAMGIFYPFISDAPTSSFDPETTHKYLSGIKDIFGQAIIMTKDVEIDGDAFKDLLAQPKVTKIYELQSQLFCDDDKEPDLNEVSTLVTPLK